MSGTIELSSHDQARLTIALELDHAGYADAAKWLRSRVLPLRDVKWDEEVLPLVPSHVNWADVFRAHRGSLPPVDGLDEPTESTNHQS